LRSRQAIAGARRYAVGIIEWREPTAEEEGLLALLLSAEFAGKEAIARQLGSAQVRVIDSEGSLALRVSSSERADVKHRIPVEAEAHDRDGVMVHMLLHVVDGVVSELEIYKEDSSPILDLPPANEWHLIELHG
jgi:hypothetical protein